MRWGNVRLMFDKRVWVRGRKTYVIKAAARVWKKRAIATVSPER
jgi:hypothetical protein